MERPNPIDLCGQDPSLKESREWAIGELFLWLKQTAELFFFFYQEKRFSLVENIRVTAAH